MNTFTKISLHSLRSYLLAAATCLAPCTTGGLAAVSIATMSSPASAACLLNGEMHEEIAKKYCHEAQRTGCVRSMLSASNYKSCLAANKEARRSGKACVIDGRMYSEFSPEDCVEAKETGCVRRLLTDSQYDACLDSQKNL